MRNTDPAAQPPTAADAKRVLDERTRGRVREIWDDYAKPILILWAGMGAAYAIAYYSIPHWV